MGSGSTVIIRIMQAHGIGILVDALKANFMLFKKLMQIGKLDTRTQAYLMQWCSDTIESNSMRYNYRIQFHKVEFNSM